MISVPIMVRSARIPIVENAVNLLVAEGVKPYKIACYTLIKDVDESYKRIMAMRALGINPFAQPYRDFETNTNTPTQAQKDLARWVNNKAVFKSCTWEEYQKDREQRRKHR